MLTLLVGAIVGVIIGLIYYKKFNLGPSGLFLGFLIFFVSFLVFVLGSKCTPQNWVQIETIELHTLNDMHSTEGSFFLGCGNINSNPYYNYYEKTGNGFIYGQVSAYKSRIHENETLKNHGFIEVFGKQFVNPAHNLFFDESMLQNRRFYEIHIPKGSLKQDFKIDLQ